MFESANTENSKMHQEHMRVQYLYKSLAMRTKQLQTLLEMHVLLTQGSTRISYNRLYISAMCLCPVLEPASPLNLVILSLLQSPRLLSRHLLLSEAQRPSPAFGGVAHPPPHVAKAVVPAVEVQLLADWLALGAFLKVNVTIGSFNVDRLRSLCLEMRREGNSRFDVDARQLTTIRWDCSAGGWLVTNLAIGALDLIQLQLSSGDFGVHFGALFAGKLSDSNQTPETILAEEPSSSAAENTRRKEVELKSSRLEGCDNAEEDS
jgi:hypothetical protein